MAETQREPGGTHGSGAFWASGAARGTRTIAAPTRRLAGWLPAGMIDWPGRVAATIFLAGCPYRCSYCHNPDLEPLDEPDSEWTALLGHFAAKRSWLDGVVVTGGEPTADPDVISLLAALKDVGMPVKLDTNGGRPEVIAHAMAEGLVDYVALDVKAAPEHHDTLTGVPGSFGSVMRCARMLIDGGVRHEFRTTAYPGAVTLGDLSDIAAELRGGTLYAIQQFRPHLTLTPEAGEVLPYTREALRQAARECSRNLPTIVRGVG